MLAAAPPALASKDAKDASASKPSSSDEKAGREDKRAETLAVRSEFKPNRPWECQWCQDLEVKPGDAESSVSRLRHQWCCPRRTFRCPFPDCQKDFTWAPVFASAPRTVTDDPKNETEWLRLVNRAFARHVIDHCGLQWVCQKTHTYPDGRMEHTCPDRKGKSVAEAKAHQKLHRDIETPLEPFFELIRDLHKVPPQAPSSALTLHLAPSNSV
jgi:hypothetical protein